jgi:ankyrin repeat protein
MIREEIEDPRRNARIERMIRPELLRRNEPLKWSPGTGTEVWEMFCSAIIGDTDRINRLLDQDPTLVRATFEYLQPLYFAVRENQVATASFLLSRGADPAYLFGGDSLLIISRDRGYAEMEQLISKSLAGPTGHLDEGIAVAECIRNRDLEALKKLLDNSTTAVHSADDRNNQPIHWAVMTRQPEIIEELIARGADINAKRSDGARPIQLVNGDYHFRGWTKDYPVKPAEILALLKSKGAFVDMCTAAYTGDINRVKELLQLDPSLANRVSEYVTYYLGSGAPIKNAAAGGHMEIVKLLLEHGADPNLGEEGIAPEGQALHSAVCNGHIEIVKLLLAHGAHPNVQVESSADTLQAAIARDNKAMIDLLCENGAASPLALLAYYGDLRTGAAVLSANPALANDPYALECAAGEGQDKFVRLILRYQPALASKIAVGVNTQGPQGPVKSRELADFLFQHGMDANLPNWLRITPLHKFAGRGDLESAELFIDRGADLEARDETISSTALGWAAKFGRLSMAEMLLTRGAKPNQEADPDWATPMAWAIRRGHQDIVELLRNHGAEK